MQNGSPRRNEPLIFRIVGPGGRPFVLPARPASDAEQAETAAERPAPDLGPLLDTGS